MPGINQLPAGSEFAAAISLTWASLSWISSGLLLWLTYSHRERWSYLAMLAASSLVSTTFSIVQQGRDITWYRDMVTAQFEYKIRKPGNDPELAVAGGSIGVDAVLFYFQYYSYNVQAMLVMFWALELCQLTYQVGERRKIRHILRNAHTAGKFISWILPLMTILCLRIPSLKKNLVGYILVADLPLMISLAIGSSLMIAVTVKYVQARKKFTQWSPPKYNNSSANSGSQIGGGASTHSSSQRVSTAGQRGLYDRWLMVRFTIAFVLLAVFEVTNTLFQITSLNNNIRDNKAAAPDLSASRAIQTMFLFIPGTTQGVFLYIIFGTTAASRKKVLEILVPKTWRGSCLGRVMKKQQQPAPLPSGTSGAIKVETSLTITSGTQKTDLDLDIDDDDDEENAKLSDPSETISLADMKPRRTRSTVSFHVSANKPLPPTPLRSHPTRPPPVSKFSRTMSSPENVYLPSSMKRRGPQEDERYLKELDDSFDLSRTRSEESSRPATGASSDEWHRLGPEHSDDSGPILPIQRPEVRFAEGDNSRQARSALGLKSFSRPGR